MKNIIIILLSFIFATTSGCKTLSLKNKYSKYNLNKQELELMIQVINYYSIPYKKRDIDKWYKMNKNLLSHVPNLLQKTKGFDRSHVLSIVKELEMPELMPIMINLLNEMLDKPHEIDGSSRITVCQIMGKYKNQKAIPVLIKALEDSYKNVDYAFGGWESVWDSADKSLREITGANPIRPYWQNIYQGPSKDIQRKVQNAWRIWWEQNKYKYEN